MYFHERCWFILIEMSQKFVPMGPVNNKSLLSKMVSDWHRI